MKHYLSIFLSLLLVTYASTPAFAAEKKVVLQITDDSIQKQVLVLNVADNLYSKYGKDLKLEVVAFGPGFKMMLSSSSYSDRLHRLAKQGVQLSACRNTSMKMEKMLDKKLDLQEGVSYVSGGAVRILELIDKGYVLLRP